MTYTLTLTGTSSVLSCDIFPPINLHKNYSIGLLSIQTYNSAANIIENENNKFHYGDKVIEIPTGAYEIDAIADYLKKHMVPPDSLKIWGNVNTLKVEFLCTQPVYFNKEHSIGSLLGFTKHNVLEKNVTHKSDQVVNIHKINTIVVNCSKATGSYRNGKPEHSIYEFSPTVPPGYKIVQEPSPVIYFPIVGEKIDHVTVTLTDQDNNIIDFRKEEITVRLHLKKDGV